MKSLLILTLGAAALLAACSDGNGISEDQSGNNNGNGGAGGDAGITAANAMVVTRITYQTALSTDSAAEFSGGTGLVVGQPGVVTKLDGSFGTANAVNPATASVPIPPTVENCEQGGTSTLSGDVADPFTPTLTAGDFFDITFAQCNDGFTTADGNLFYEVDAFNGDLLSGIYDLTMTATFTDFQVTTATDTLVSNGDITVRLNTLLIPDVSAETSGVSLTIDGSLGSQTLTNFAASHTQDVEAVPSPYSQTSTGTLDSTMLPGVVTYSTPVTLTGFDAEYPSAGEFLISGADSSARLIAVDNVNILIEVDADGDGVVDEVIETTWAALEAT